MATTRIIPAHLNKGKTNKQCLSERLDYGKKPDKTNSGELIFSYACDPDTADAEFALSKREYFQLTGRKQGSDGLYIRFANPFIWEDYAGGSQSDGIRICAKISERKLRFIVCIHVEKRHTQNHIYWNSISLHCTRKFRNCWGSTMAVRRRSDLICAEHCMSVVENPKPYGMSYNRWHGDVEKLSNRDWLCFDIDEALAKKPHDFEGFLSLIEQARYAMGRGKIFLFITPDRSGIFVCAHCRRNIGKMQFGKCCGASGFTIQGVGSIRWQNGKHSWSASWKQRKIRGGALL